MYTVPLMKYWTVIPQSKQRQDLPLQSNRVFSNETRYTNMYLVMKDDAAMGVASL